MACPRTLFCSIGVVDHPVTRKFPEQKIFNEKGFELKTPLILSEGRTGGSLARFMNGKTRGSWIQKFVFPNHENNQAIFSFYDLFLGTRNSV